MPCSVKVEQPEDQIKNDREYKFLLDKILRNRNIDFSQYQPQILKRRIQHRLHLAGCAAYWDYILLLNRDPQEYDRLIECLTIKVSEFFRDPRVFDLLGDIIIPEVIAQKQVQGVKKIRVWSCGAAFGQEAYSVAILFCEFLGNRLDDFDIKILATDIDTEALVKAPWGSFDRKALRNMGAHILFKYFTRFQDRFVVSDGARALVNFENHDIVSGDLKSSMDLILCRNLLIYFQKELQEKVLSNLCIALNPGGFLIVGKTESLPPDMFDCLEIVDLKERIYQKK